MNFFPQRPAQNLPEWLDIATRGLVPSARARIRVEIEAHYAEAVAIHRENGWPEPAAQTAALADLGDRYTAGRRFRREHLTEKDAQKAGEWIKAAGGRGLFQFAVMYVQSLFPIYALWNINDLHSRICLAVYLALFLIYLSAGITAYVLVARKPTSTTRRRIILLASFNWLNVGILVLVDYFAAPPGHAPASHQYYINLFLLALTDILFVLAAYLSLGWLRLGKKLASAGEDDLSSQTPAVA